jgi:hypothetical protein
VPFSIQPFLNTSDKMVHRNELEQLEVQDLTCPHQETNKEEKCSMVPSIKDVEISPRTN